MASVFTIALDRPFVDLLARGLLRGDPERLADTLVLLPSRRACLMLRDTFLALAGGRPLLLPRMRPVGDLDDDELRLDATLELDLPPAIGPLRRQLLLTRLVLARDGSTPHEQAVRLAAALARFLDEVQTEGVPLDRLEGLVEGDLAEHWRLTLRFLQILGESWPAILAGEGVIDAAERRNRLLDAAARRWQAHPPAHPVLAAGILGSVPAVARLLAVVARLPMGAVVLPGLDGELDEASWQRLDASHPQYALRRLLEVMAVERGVVAPWPEAAGAGRGAERARLLAEVLRPAATTEAWQTLPPPPAAALDGLTLVEAPDLASEALQLALRMRAALETPDRHATLVTADRNLARRVAVELRRWGVEIDDSAGVPLDQSPPGGLLLLAAHMVCGDCVPVPLLATLKHPLTRGGMRQGDFRRYVRALERVALRGPRPAGGLDGLIGRLRAWPADEPWTAPVPREELLAWLVRLKEAARPFHALAAAEAAPFAALLEAHLALAEWLASDETGDAGELWAKAAGACAHEFVSELREAARDFGLVPKGAYPAMLAVLMGTHAVRPRAPRHPRLQILGQLESRLVQAELVLIGGLNEGVWPHGAEAGPWLSRPMRRQLGLPPVELQIGIAAHDFLAAATAPEVVLSRSRKDETGAPTTPCRWLARLDAVLRSLGLRGRVTAPPEWSAWTEALDAPRGPPRPTGRPRPCPPLAARPRELSVTAVERLMRDPYEIYASRILRLRALDPLDADPGAIQRGELIHAALEHFVRQHPTTLPPEPYETLLEIGRALFHARADRPQVMGIWWPRFLGIARWFVIQEQARRAEIVEVRAEIEGTMILDAPGGEFRIRARADRLEACRGGHVRLIDYKTGTLPKASDIRTGLKPQLPLEAAIVAAGGFKGLAATKLAEVALWGLKGGDVGGETLDPTLNYSKCVVTPAELAVQAIAGVTRLVAWFDNPATPYIAVPRPEIAPDRSDYDHLSRIAEWHGTEAEA